MARKTLLALMAVLVSGLPACASVEEKAAPTSRRFGTYLYVGTTFLESRGLQSAFAGYGADFLDPWFTFTEDGRQIIRLGFSDPQGRVSSHNSQRANIWFRRLADADGDRRLTDREIRSALERGKLIQYQRFLDIR